MLLKEKHAINQVNFHKARYPSPTTTTTVFFVNQSNGDIHGNGNKGNDVEGAAKQNTATTTTTTTTAAQCPNKEGAN